MTVSLCLPSKCLFFKTMASRASKKNKMNEVKGQEQRRERIEDQLFALEYLHNTMSYLLPSSSLLDGCLQVEPAALQSVIQRNPSQLGLHFIQKLKLMKEKCDEGMSVEDYQQHGDFINYDILKEHCQQVRALQAELREEHQKIVAIKRIRLKYPQAPQQMSLPQLQRWQQKIKQDVLDSLLKNVEKIPEEPQSRLEKSTLYREMFNIFSIEGKQENQGRPSKSVTADGATSHKKKTITDSKKEAHGNKVEKTKKISKGPKKGDSKGDLQQEYVPKVGKKAGKLDEPILNLTEKNQISIESVGVESGQYVMLRRSNQTFEEKQEKEESEIIKEQIPQAPQLNKEPVPLNQSASSAQPKVKRKYTKIKKVQKEPPSKTSKETNNKPPKEKTAHLKESKPSLKQKVEIAMIVESSEPQNKLVSLQRDGDYFKKPVQVSIGIQADVQVLLKETSKQENQASSVDNQENVKKQENILLEQKQKIKKDDNPPSNPPEGQDICKGNGVALEENLGIEQMTNLLPRSGQRESLSHGGELVPQINAQPINIEGPSSSNPHEEPDISELLKLD